MIIHNCDKIKPRRGESKIAAEGDRYRDRHRRGGGSSVVSAEVTPEQKRDVISSPEVEAIRRAVDGFEVKEVDEKRVKTESKQMVITDITTGIGDVIHVETKDGTTGAKLSLSDLSRSSEAWERIRDEYFVVEGTESTLIAEGSEVRLERTVTDQERQQLENAIPASDKTEMAVYSSSDSAYVVHADGHKYHVGPDMEDVEMPIQTEESCAYHCAACGTWAVSRGLCYAGCATAASGAGAAVCIACLTTNSVGLIFADCDECADCI